MPRQPRIDAPRIAQHVVQRGNDRRPCFFQDVDYLRYLSELRELATRAGCAIPAYVLMTNHVHLLLTPSRAGQVSAVMQALGRQYVHYVNNRYHRTGSLCEGGYKACPVDTDSYLLHCYRYIELNPVRAGMASTLGDYSWSAITRMRLANPMLSSLRIHLSGAGYGQRISSTRLCPLGCRDTKSRRSGAYSAATAVPTRTRHRPVSSHDRSPVAAARRSGKDRASV
ncbi:transposase [Lysobacter capsici]|uniref:transposase n=1 Tax=Lysobacter capsici TaxID=435897 RepID=UPI001E5E324B|nr:transposase [Lysobacter capsici]